MTYKSQFIEQFQIAAAPIPSPGERVSAKLTGVECGRKTNSYLVCWCLLPCLGMGPCRGRYFLVPPRKYPKMRLGGVLS